MKQRYMVYITRFAFSTSIYKLTKAAQSKHNIFNSL